MTAELIYQLASIGVSPAIHVVVAAEVDTRLFDWVKIGAEEEGVPCRRVFSAGKNLIAAAYAAAQESRLGVSVAVGHGETLLHEAHMPAGQPVWRWETAANAAQMCRLAGANAGRFVKRMPLRFEFTEGVAEPTQRHCVPTAMAPSEAQTGLAAAVARVLERKGLL